MKIHLTAFLLFIGLSLPAQTSTFAYDANGNQIRRERPAVSYLVHIAPDTVIQRGASVQLWATGGDSYWWSTGESTASITVRPDTTTAYVVTVHCICGALIRDTVRVKVLQSVAVEAPAGGLQFEVFPNPATESVTVRIHAAADRDIELRLVDAAGHLLRIQVISLAGSVQVLESLMGLPPGRYFYQIQGEHTLASRQFTIARL